MDVSSYFWVVPSRIKIKFGLNLEILRDEAAYEAANAAQKVA